MTNPLRCLLLVPLLAVLATGQEDHGLYFGHGGNVEIPEPGLPRPATSLSVECWFRTAARVVRPVRLVHQWSTISTDADRGTFSLELPANNRVAFHVRNADGIELSATGGASWRDDRWHHVLGTWNGTELAVYVDGKRRGSATAAEFGPLADSQRPVTVGPIQDPKAQRPTRFDGFLADVALWSTAVLPGDADRWSIPLDGDEEGLTAWYPLRRRMPSNRADGRTAARGLATVTPRLMRAGWALTRSHEFKDSREPTADVFCYDLTDTIATQGRRVLVTDLDRDRIGVLWQDGDKDRIAVTWVGANLEEPETVDLPCPDGAAFACGTTDDKGNVYYLTVTDAPRSRADGVEVSTHIHKTDATGKPLADRELSVAKSGGLNIYTFHRGARNAGSMRFAGGKLGVILPRTMHRSGDGLRHQGAIALTFSAKDLSLDKHMGQTSGHSFGNVLTVNKKGSFLGMDLGDNYPRGVHLHEFKNGRKSRLVFTYKTAHATRPRGGSPVYDEISKGGRTFYKWSNDNGVYTELGAILEHKKSYSIVFSTDRSLDGKVLDNSRAFGGCPDPRNLARVRVIKEFHRAPGGSEISNKIIAKLPRKAKPETGGFYDFGGRWKKQRVIGVEWLTDYGEREGAHAPQVLPRGDGTTMIVWERSGERARLEALVLDKKGSVATPPFPIGPRIYLNRNDRTVRMHERTYFLAGNSRGSAPRLYFVRGR